MRSNFAKCLVSIFGNNFLINWFTSLQTKLLDCFRNYSNKDLLYLHRNLSKSFVSVYRSEIENELERRLSSVCRR